MSERCTPKVRIRRSTPNKSSRNGCDIRLIILHSTESQNVVGLGDLIGLGNWFANPAAQVSAHVATDAEGNSGRYVCDEDKAWHCACFNSAALGIEQIGRAAQTSWADAQVRETARWIAYWSRKHGIPIQKGAVSGKSVTRSGIIRHSELGPAGGGHSDPGKAYPLKEVLDLARHYRALQHA